VFFVFVFFLLASDWVFGFFGSSWKGKPKCKVKMLCFVFFFFGSMQSVVFFFSGFKKQKKHL